MKAKVFQAAMEILHKASLPTAGPVTRRLDSLAEHLGNGGEVNPRGAWYVQAGRSPGNSRLTWAIDFAARMPTDPDHRRLLILIYMPAMVCGCLDASGRRVLRVEMGRCPVCHEEFLPYPWTPDEKRRAGGVSKAFWGRVSEARLYGPGMRIVDGMKWA